MKRFLSVFMVIIVCVTATVTAGGKKEASATARLEFWDTYTSEVDEVDAIIAEFTRRNPGVAIERTTMASGDIFDIIRPALESGRGPDIAMVETGIPFVGPMVRAGYLLELTDAWRERGWKEKLFPLAHDVPDYAGRVFGVGTEIEYVPIYYNVDLWNQLGLGPEPRTIQQLESIMERVKSTTDIIPMAFAARDWWPNSNFMTSILWAHLGPEKALALNEGRGSWDIPEVREAVRRLVDWHQKGYFIEDAQAVAYSEGIDLFTAGLALMHPTGNWIVGAYRGRDIGFEIGSINWPAPAGRKAAMVSFVGDGFIVNARTANPGTAIDFLDFLVADPQVAKMWYETVHIIPPLMVGIPTDTRVDPLLREVLDAQAAGEIALVPGISMMAPPRVMTFMETNIQRLMTRDLTVDSWIREKNRLWEEGRAEGMTKSTFSWD